VIPDAEHRHYRMADGATITPEAALKAANRGQAVTASVTWKGESSNHLEAAFRPLDRSQAPQLARILTHDFDAQVSVIDDGKRAIVVARGDMWTGRLQDRLRLVLQYLSLNAHHAAPGRARTAHERRTEGRIHAMADDWRRRLPLLPEELARHGLGRYAKDIQAAVVLDDARDRLLALPCAPKIWRLAQSQVQPAFDASFTLHPARVPLLPRIPYSEATP
jgi:hypothetical protein